MHQRSRLPVDASCYNPLLARCVQCGDAAGFQYILREMDGRNVPPNGKTFTIIMRSQVKRGDGKGALRVYTDALTAGSIPGSDMRCVAIAAHFLEGDPDAALSIAEEADRESGMTARICGAIVSGLSKLRRYPEAIAYQKSVYEKHVKFRMTLRVYTMLMNAEARLGNVDAVHRHYERILEDGLTPDHHVFGVLIWMAFHIQQSCDTAMCRLAQMRKYGLEPNAHIIAMFVDGFCRSGATDSAIELLESSAEGGNGNVVAYTTILRVLVQSGNQGVDRAWKLFRHLSDGSASPAGSIADVVTYTVMMDAHTRTAESLNIAHELLADMVRNGVTPDATIYNIFLTAHVRFASTDSTLSVLDAMIDAGVKPTVETFTILIWMYTRQHKSSHVASPITIDRDPVVAPIALAPKPTVRRRLHRPHEDVHAFCTLASAYARRRSALTLKRLLDEMKHQGARPDRRAFAHLLAASAGDPEAVENVVREMEKHGFRRETVVPRPLFP
ncbi:hypothetical protein HKX48_005968 [Thoreauomyces humboldtii]|nr:hypothetical protein HKX48_005968 [Thoreauomyces humboldtii]